MPRFDDQLVLNNIPISGVVVEQVTSDPVTDLIDGRLIYRNDTDQYKVCLSGAWVVIFTSNTGTPILSGGTAGGALTGTWPNPGLANNSVVAATIQDGTLTDSEFNAAYRDGADGVQSLRSLGYTSGKAMPGVARLDQLAAPTASVSMGTQKITNLLDPTSAQDAASKAYVDSVAQGLDAKHSVLTCTTANLSGWSAGQFTGMPTTLNGQSLAVNSRILVKDQTLPQQNGIYVVTSLGTGANGVWDRSADMNNANEFDGAFTFVEEGTANAHTSWVCTTSGTFSMNSDPVAWSKFSSPGDYTGGNGLTLTGLDFSVNVDGSSIEINADSLRVKAAGITNAMLAGSIDLATKMTGLLPVANGGTNANSAAGARTNLGATGKYAANSPALTAGTWSANITHSLNSTDVIVQVRDASTNEVVIVDIDIIDANNIAIRSAITRAASFYRVVVIG